MAFYGSGFGGGFGGGGWVRGGAVFDTHFCCFSAAMAGRANIEDGDKILLPPSALDALSQLNVEYPMKFELINEALGKKTHCGVLEFSAEEGRCYMPFWMMQNLLLDEGSIVKIKNVALPKAEFVKFRAQSCDFLSISNPRAVLEVTLRKFTCLTEGDVICINHSGLMFHLDVKEVKPNGAASIIETDCRVDFDEPLGYKEWQEKELAKRERADSFSSSGGNRSRTSSDHQPVPVTRELQKAKAVAPEETTVFKAFAGNAQRIDGRPTAAAKMAGSDAKSSREAMAAAATARAEAAAAARVAATTTTATATATADKKEQAAPVPLYQPKIGDKYSKKKASVMAFGGPAHKLT